MEKYSVAEHITFYVISSKYVMNILQFFICFANLSYVVIYSVYSTLFSLLLTLASHIFLHIAQQPDLFYSLSINLVCLLFITFLFRFCYSTLFLLQDGSVPLRNWNKSTIDIYYYYCSQLLSCTNRM